jgi:hypothetical protein
VTPKTPGGSLTPNQVKALLAAQHKSGYSLPQLASAIDISPDTLRSALNGQLLQKKVLKRIEAFIADPKQPGSDEVCHFCGKSRWHVVCANYAKPASRYYVLCEICKAHGPEATSKDEAAPLWLKRAPSRNGRQSRVTNNFH